jgi:DNA-binding NtrC family response regulator
MEKKSPGLRVLVVDDELLARWSIAETLADAGHTVIEAGDGAAAVRALTDASPPIDVVLLDYRLADSNGLTLLATVRRLVPGTPVVVMTAYGSPDVTRGALELGACEVLDKPFDIHDLGAIVRRAHGLRPH